MPTQLPHGLQKLLEVTVGMPWPEGDESGLRAISVAWGRFARSLSALGPPLETEAQTFSEAMEGQTAQQIETALAGFPANIEELRHGAGEFAKATENAAADIQKVKIMIIVQLVVLAGAIADLLASLFGAIFVPAVVAAARVGIGAILRALLSRLAQAGMVNIMRTLVKNMVKYALINTVIMEGLDLGIQAGQILAGGREGLDKESLKNTAIGGVIGGAAWGLGAGVSRVLSRSLTEGRLLAPGWFKPFAHLGYSAGQMALITALTPGIDKATHGSGSVFEGILGNLSKADVHAPRFTASSIKPIGRIAAVENLPVLSGKSGGTGFVAHRGGTAPGVKATVPVTADRAAPGRRSGREAPAPGKGQAPDLRGFLTASPADRAGQMGASRSPATGARPAVAGTGKPVPESPAAEVPTGRAAAPDGGRASGLRDFLTTSSPPSGAGSTGSALAAGHAPSAAPPGMSHETGSGEPEHLVHPVAEPVRPEQWTYRREGAPVGELRTARFDPARGAPAGDGTLPGRSTRISADVRRIQADDGRWVRDMTLALPVRFGEGFPPERLPEFERRWQAALDRQFNTGLLLPRSGDQLHVGVRLTPAAAGQEAVELSMSAAPTRSDQLHFRLQDEGSDTGQAAARNDLLALHELSHFAGVPDTYVDPGSVFRDTAAKAGGPGIMSDVTRVPEQAVPRKYLVAIENAIDSGPVVHDHPLPAELEYGRPLATISEEAVREPALHAPAAGFEGLLGELKVRISEAAGAPAGAGTHAVELTGPAEAVRRYRASPVDGPLAEHLPAGFTVSDTATGSRFHFSGDGALTAAEVQVEGGRGTLRRDFSAPEQPPALVSPEQHPQERFPVEVRPDGTIGLVSVSGDGRALERLVVDPADGRIVETTAFGRHILFPGGSSRLSPDELRAIDELAASTVREGLAAFDAKRPLPEVTIEGHGNGTVLGQPNEGRALRSGLDRAKAVEKAFTYSLEKYLARAAAERPVAPAASDFLVKTSSQGRTYPEGVSREDGVAARRRAVLTVTPHQAVPEVAPEPPRTTLRDLLDAEAELVRAERAARPPHAELPWYVAEGSMDALGEVAIAEVDRWGEDEVRLWAAEIANAVVRGGDSPALATGIRSSLDRLLAGPGPEGNEELDFWEKALQRGQVTTADGHVVWLRPVLRDVHPLPPAEASPIQRYNVNWGTLTTAERSESARGLSADAIMLSTARTGMHVVSNVTSAPYLGMSAHRTTGTSHKRYVIFDRKIWMLQGRPFRGGLHVRVFVDGEERLHDVVTEPRVTADLPKVLTEPGALRPAPHVVPPGTDPVAGVPRAHEVINAIDLIPVAAEFQRRLRGAGLPPEGTRQLSEQTLALLNERAVMNRSRFLLGNEVVTDRVSFPAGFGRSFKGHVALRAVVEGLEYLGDTPKVAVREDSGGSVKVHRERGGKSGFEAGARVNVAPLEFATVEAGMTRATGHGLTEETSIHTVLQTVDDQSRYRAWLRVTVEPRSTTHEIEPVVRIVPTEIGVPAAEAADFERRLLGEDAHLLRSGDGEATPRPYVRAALADTADHGFGLPESAYRRPARLDAPLPQPHPRESLALASRRGIGFAAANGLPGAERIHDQLRTVLLQKHREWTGNGRVDLSGVDRVLLSGFGRPVLEGDLAGLLAGVEHPVRLGGETYHLSATATLLERVGGVTGDEARAMSINVRASRITAVDGHRDTSWRVGGFLGVRAKVELTPELKAQLGQAGLSGSFGGGTRHEFSGSAKASQRAEMGGKADEHVYNVVYELSVRSGDRVVRWWIDEPGEVVARVVLSQLHTPPEPIPADALADVGRIALWRALPAGSTVDFRTNGTGAVFRSFLAVSEVPRMAAHVYRQANRLPEEWLEERGNWPAELRKAFSPTELATHLAALTSDGGRLTELPDGTDGWHQALRVRVVFKDPRHVTAHGAGKPFQMWQNTSTSAKYARTDKRSRAGGAGAHVGLSVTLGAVSGLADGEDAGSPRAEGEGHGLTGHLYALGGGSLEREYRTEHGAATYPVGITRGTYSGPMHSYRADPVFEITLSRWAKGSVIDRLTGRPRGMQDITRVVEVKDGVEFVLPERRIFDLGLPVPDGVSVADPKTPEGHLDLAMLPGGTHPEVLHADGVLTAMKRWLTGQGLLRPGADGVVHVPTPLLGELEASFSSSALLNQFTLLTTSGVMRWWPLESAFGSTRYLWARVTAETLEPMSQMDRPEMAAMLRGKAFTELSTSTSRSTGGEAGIDLRAWLGGSFSAGVEGKAGYGESSETSHEKGDENVDIYWGQTKNPSVELKLRQRFRVQLRITRQQPELFSAPARGLRKASLAVAGWTGHRREVAEGRQNTSLSDERFEAVTDGDVRVIVPRHLIVPGPPPPRSPAGAAGADPVWESSEPLPENRELVDLVIEHGHPWALPAVAAVHRWAAVAGAPSLTRPGFAKPEIWRPEGTTVEGMLYDLFTNEVLMRLNLPSLLRFGYSVPVGPEKVVLGLRITHLTPMPQHDVDILSRHYNQGREVDENVRGGSRGLRLGLGLIGGGQPEEGGRVSDRLPLEYELELSDEQTTESQEIMERNVSSTRPFRYYRADVDVVIRSERHGRLRVHVPDGLYLMLPTSLSEEPALITNS